MEFVVGRFRRPSQPNGSWFSASRHRATCSSPAAAATGGVGSADGTASASHYDSFLNLQQMYTRSPHSAIVDATAIDGSLVARAVDALVAGDKVSWSDAIAAAEQQQQQQELDESQRTVLEKDFDSNPRRNLSDDEADAICGLICTDQVEKVRRYYEFLHDIHRRARGEKLEDCCDGEREEEEGDNEANEDDVQEGGRIGDDEIQEILDMRFDSMGRLELLIRWKGFSSDWDSWEISSNIPFNPVVERFILSRKDIFSKE